MAAGNIVIDLLMRTGSFVTDTARAARSMRTLKKEALDFAAVFKASFAGGLATGAVTELVSQLSRIPGALNDLVKGAGAFDDLSERIGISASELASFTLAAAAADTSIESIVEFSTKLTKALSKTDDEADNAAKALAAIGLQFREFKKLDPAQQIDALSKALAGFEKGPERTAILEGLVRGGSQILPLLKAVNEQQGRQKLLTDAQIAAADEFSDRQAVAAAQLKAYAQIAVIDALPAVTALTNAFVEFAKELTGIGTASARLNGDSAIRVWAESAALTLGAFVDSLRKTAADITVFVATTKKEFAELVVLDARAKDALTRLSTVNFKDASGDVKAALDARNKAVADANQALLDRQNLDGKKFETLVKKQLDAIRLTGARADATTDPRSTTFGQKKPKIDVPNFGTDAATKDDPTKKLLDNRLKEQERAISKESALLADRNRFLNLFNDQGLLSIDSYYDAQLAIIDAATSSQIAAYDKQLAALRAFQASATKATDRADAQGKIDDVLEKRSKAEQDAGAKALELGIKREQAEKRFQDQIKATSANVLELQGNLAAAAAVRFDLQNADLIAKAAAEGNENLKALLGTLRAAAIAQADFTKQSENSRDSFDKLANAEERIAISRLAGARTSIEALVAVGEERKKQIPIIEAEVEALEAIARASGNAGLVQQAEQARLALERLKATADPLGDVIRDTFTGSATDAITDFVTGTKTAKEAFKSFADSVVQQIVRMAAQNLAEQIFGQGGSSGGNALVSLFASFFGGGFAAGGLPPVGKVSVAGERGVEAFFPRTTTEAQTTRAIEAMSARGAQTVHGAALIGKSGPQMFRPSVPGYVIPADETKILLRWFPGFGGAFASGGAPPTGRPSLGGEKGAELFFPHTRTAKETSREIQRLVSRDSVSVRGATLIGKDGPQMFRPSVPGYVIPAKETEILLRRFPDFGGAFAGGGMPPVGRSSMGGEMGRELFIPNTAGRAPPKDDRSQNVRSGPTVNNSFVIPAPTERRTQQQIATEVGRAVSRAMARGDA